MDSPENQPQPTPAEVAPLLPTVAADGVTNDAEALQARQTLAPSTDTVAPARTPDVDEISEEELQAIGPAPYTPSTTVQQDDDVVMAVKPGEFDENAPTLPLPSDTYVRTDETMNALPDFDPEATPDGARWQAILKAGLETMPHAGSFLPTVEREDAQWRQGVLRTDGEKGRLGVSRLKFGGTGPLSTGDKAILETRALLGLGAVNQIPLWHSGFWISIKAPSDAAVSELHRRLADEKILMGRRTHGMAYANNSVFLAAMVVDFVLDHVYDTSLKEPGNIRELISSLDIPLLAWGIATVMWPRGFQYARAKLSVEGKPTSVVEQQKLNVNKLLWVDNSRLTPWQISHMAGRHGSNMTTDAVRKYQGEFTHGKDRHVTIADGLVFELSVPNVDTYLTAGQRWINDIVAMVERAFGVSDNYDQRNKVIFEQGKATHLRQYSHWCTAIRVGDDGDGEPLRRHATVADVESQLNSLSSEDAYMQTFFKGVRDTMQEATMAIIAIPTFDTEGPYVAPLPRFPHLLPLDAIVTFFTLLVQRATQIQRR